MADTTRNSQDVALIHFEKQLVDRLASLNNFLMQSKTVIVVCDIVHLHDVMFTFSQAQ